MQHSVLVVALQGLGNTLLLTPLLRLLKAGLPESRLCTLAFNNGSEQILRDNPNVDEVYQLDHSDLSLKSLLGLIGSLRSQRFDLAVVAWPGGPRSALLALLSGAKTRVGHSDRQRWGGFLLALAYTHTVRVEPSQHDLERNLELARPLGIDMRRASRQLTMQIGGQARQYRNTFLKRQGIVDGDIVIAMQPGSSPLQTWKRWPTRRFAELAGRLVAECGAKILCFGSPQEAMLLSDVVEQVDGAGVAVTKASVNEAAALLERCNAVIGNDSALMHLGASVDVPCVSIMGPTNRARTAPYGPLHRVVALRDPICRPGYRFHDRTLKCSRCAGLRVPLCLDAITVDEVFSAVRDVLARSQQSTHVVSQGT